VLRLCWRYGLLTALTYILNRGLNDYMGPAAHLLMALLRPSAHSPSGDSKAAGYRLLVYLRCCLTGCSFPPGAQAMPMWCSSHVSSAAEPCYCSAFPVCLLRQLLYMLAVWCCREVVLMAGKSCLGVQSTKHGDLTLGSSNIASKAVRCMAKAVSTCYPVCLCAKTETSYICCR